METVIIRPKQLAPILGVSEPTMYRWIQSGHLPRPRRIGPNVTGWIKSEILDWLESRPVERCMNSKRIELMQAARGLGDAR